MTSIIKDCKENFVANESSNQAETSVANQTANENLLRDKETY